MRNLLKTNKVNNIIHGENINLKEIIEENKELSGNFEEIYNKFKFSIKEVKQIYKRFEREEKNPTFSDINKLLIRNFHQLNQNLEETFNELKGHELGFKLYQDFQQRYQEVEKLKEDFNNAQDKNEKVNLALNIAKIYTGMEDWEASVNILKELIKEEKNIDVIYEIKGRILRELGISMTKLHKDSYMEYERGREYLKKAIELNPKDFYAYSSFGSTWKHINKKRAYQYYLKALEITPKNSYPLINAILLRLALKKKIKSIKKFKKYIDIAIQERLIQVSKSEDIPWAFFDLGTLYLLRGNIKSSLNYYLLAIRDSPDIWTINTTIKTLDIAYEMHTQIPGMEKVRTLLLLGMGFFLKKLKKEETQMWQYLITELNKYGFKRNDPPLKDSIIILAGGVNNIEERKLKDYFKIFKESFKEFKGELICGCQVEKINEFVSNFYTMMPNISIYYYNPFRENLNDTSIKLVYQIPKEDLDLNYNIIFSYWFDVLNSLSNPNDIKMLCLNGGDFSSLEYRLAIAFGVSVGIVKESGVATMDLINDNQWKKILSDANVKTPYYLYKELKNSVGEISNFIKRPFIKNPELENLRLLLIQDLNSGTVHFDINFFLEAIDIDLQSGFLNSIDDWGYDAFKVGRAISIGFEDMYIFGDFIFDKRVKVIFFLKHKPSKWLDERISIYLKKLEQIIGDEFIQYLDRSAVYPLNSKMREIIRYAFGEDALKLAEYWYKNKNKINPMK